MILLSTLKQPFVCLCAAFSSMIPRQTPSNAEARNALSCRSPWKSKPTDKSPSLFATVRSKRFLIAFKSKPLLSHHQFLQTIRPYIFFSPVRTGSFGMLGMRSRLSEGFEFPCKGPPISPVRVSVLQGVDRWRIIAFSGLPGTKLWSPKSLRPLTFSKCLMSNSCHGNFCS